MNRPRGIAFLLLLAVVLPLGQARADKALNALKPFLQTHCLECHGPDKQKSEIRFDTLGADLIDLRTLEIWTQCALSRLVIKRVRGSHRIWFRRFRFGMRLRSPDTWSQKMLWQVAM